MPDTSSAIRRNPVEVGLVPEPWQYRWASSRAYALGQPDPLLAYNVWYQSLGLTAEARQQRWRAFLLGDDPHEEMVRRGDGVVGDEVQRRSLQQEAARPSRRRGRPRKAPLRQQDLFPEFDETP